MAAAYENAFLRGIGWLGASQGVVRVARLGSTIVIARWLAPEHFGLAAVVLAVNELSHVFASAGTASRVIKAEANELESVCRSANTLNWIIGVCLFCIQCLIAFPLAQAYDAPELIYLVWFLATSYLLLPIAQVQCALNMRDQRMDVVAKSQVAQAVGDSLLTILMALAGCGVWALIVPKVLVVPAWIWMHRRTQAWRATSWFHCDKIRSVLQFTRRVLVVEILGVVRHNIDYILIGYFLGLEALGIYFFAYNAGLGLSRGFIVVLSQALYPHLCDARSESSELHRRFASGLRLNVLVVTAVVALQSVFAPHYIPLIFGERWVELGAVPLVVLVCLSGIPMSVSDVFSQLLRAENQVHRDQSWHLGMTIAFALTVLVSLNWGLVGVAFGIAAFYYVSTPIHYFLNIRPVLDGGSVATRQALG